MKIISWDVGIIHLAYCILEKNDDDIKIINWGNINLLNDEKHNCYGFINSSKNNCQCDKKCKYYYENNNNKYYFCGLHKNQYLKINKDELIINKYTGENLCQQITSKGIICNKKSNSIINNLIICNYHCKKIQNDYINNTVKKICSSNASKAPIEIIKKNLILQMENNKDFLNVDYVLIENQPSMKNPKMKSVSETLYSWFLIRGIIDEKKIKNIYYLSPSNKIKVKNDDIDKEIKDIKDQSKKYKFTKNIGIIYTRDILKNDNKWLNFLNSNNKKDDLCDSYLQGLYFFDNINKFIK